jgi:hypothetical protein
MTQEREIEGYFGKFAMFMCSLTLIIVSIGFLRWNLC